MKKFFLLAFLLLYSFNSFSLTFELNNDSYMKGETIFVSGKCGSFSGSAELIINSKEKDIFDSSIECFSGSDFSFNYEIDFLDPSGVWDLSIDDKVKAFPVQLSRESGFLLIDFLSPLSPNVFRTDDINITVKVSEAGESVSTAAVSSWDVFGEKRELVYKGEGIYSLAYEVPFDADFNSWNLIVVAKDLGSGSGGEAVIPLLIKKAPIRVELLEPVVSNFDLTTNIPVKAKISYINGKKVINPRVSVLFNNKEFFLSQESEGVFSFIYNPKEDDVGSLALIVSATDSAGNEGEASKNLVLTFSTLYYVIAFGPFAFVFLILISLVYFFVSRKFKESRKAKSFAERKTEIEAKVSGLQEQYFNKALISKDSFSKEMAKLEKELIDLEKEL
ncbi:MAG TPA: hypothetical protein VJK05_03455 [archaeon]|nr:hypothetical protein [archaeon]